MKTDAEKENEWQTGKEIETSEVNVKREEDERKKESGDENKIEKFRNNVVDFLLGINREHNIVPNIP